MESLRARFQESTLVNVMKEKIKSEGKGIRFIERENEEDFISYMDFCKEALFVLYYLQNQGIGRSDELILQVDDNKRFLTIFWACLLGGIIPVPLTVAGTEEGKLKVINVWKTLHNPRIVTNLKNLCTLEEYAAERNGELSNIIRKNFILEDDLFDNVTNEGKVCEVNSDDIAFIQFTSGSTGEPKGVVLTHSNLLHNILASIDCGKITKSDSMITWMPLTHDMGLIGFHLLPLILDINQYLIPTKSFIRNPMLWLNKVCEHKVTLLSSPNFGYNYFLSGFNSEAAKGWDLSHVRLIFNGAEPISAKLCNDFLAEMEIYGLKRNAMYTVYGMAEASLVISFPPCEKEFEVISLDRNNLHIGEKVIDIADNADSCVQFVNVGYPVTDCSVRICDEKNILLEDNRIGHIQIKGKNVTSRYYNNQVATQKAYTLDGWLRTGDLGFIRNGMVVITGRYKDILFINGQNYYPHDLERIIEEMDVVSKGGVAACGVYNNKAQKEEIGLFVLYKKKIEDFIHIYKGLNNIINKKLGINVSNIIPIKRMPKTTSGKIQRYKLTDMYQNGKFDDVVQKLRELIAVDQNTDIADEPSNAIAQGIYEICQESLKIDRFGIHDNLIELGIGSIESMQIVAKINDEFGCNISMNDFINDCTVFKLSKLIGKSNVTKERYIYQIKPDLEKLYHPFPLTDIQAAYLLGRDEIYEIGGVSTHFYFELESLLDMERLNKSLNNVLEGNPMLRAVILKDGTQKILESVPEYKINVTNVSRLNPTEIGQAILKQRNEMSHSVFETHIWPLFEIKALKIPGDRHYLFFSFDMLVMDGASIQIFARELMTYYNSQVLEPKSIRYSFRDYVLALGKLKESQTYKRSKDYWMDKLEQFPPAPVLPMIRTPEKISEPRFNRVEKIIEKDRWQILKQKAQENGITVSALLCTAYATVLSYWSGQDTFAINLTTFNRIPFHKDVYKIIGDFTSVVLLGLDFANKTAFMERAKYLQTVMFEALENRYFDGVQFIREIARRNDFETRAVMPIIFTSMILGDESYSWSELGEIKMGISQTSQVYLDNQVVDMDGRLRITWDFVEDIFDNDIIECMFDQYTGILENLAAGNEYISLKPDDSHKKTIDHYNETKEVIILDTLQELFRRQAAKTPFNTAVICDDEYITYNELDIESDRVATYLRSNGIGVNDLVGVYTKRCTRTIINILGVLKAGAAYVPIDMDYPDERKRYIIENSNCKTVLEPERILEYVESSAVGFLNNIDGSINDIAYVIYTSGSTGKPKGVVIKHAAVANTIIDINRKFGVNEKDRIAGISSMCFDLSVYDIFGTLTAGATLVLVKDHRDVNDLYNTLVAKRVTIWNSVPAIMSILMDNTGDRLKNASLRLVLLSGDWIPVNLPARIKNYMPDTKVISLGGATEASIWSIYYPIKEIDEKWTSIPYGIPLSNQKIYVLNNEKTHCPLEVPGEIYIGGVGVAECYVNDPVKTEKAFIHHLEYGRLYRTGDFGVLHKEGYIEFLGRRDSQLKIRGYRIELGEIESSLLEYGTLNSAVVIDRIDESGNKFLCAYITSNEEIKPDKLRSFLSDKLPHYMIPTYFIQLEELPLNSNGKIDRKRMPEPVIGLEKQERKAPVPPRNKTEEALVAVWTETLGADEIGIEDNFFELGGDSIKAIQISARLQKYQFLMEVRDILRYQTIKTLSEHVREAEIQISQEQVTGDIKLSPAQKWFFSKVFTDIHHWNLAVSLSSRNGFDEQIILDVFNKIVEHHDALRITFDVQEGCVSQHNLSYIPGMVSLHIFDFRQSENYEQLMADETKRLHGEVDLSKGPLFKLGLFKTTKEDYLVIIIHHLIIDGISLRIILEDFYLGYQQAANKQQIIFQKKTHSFKYWVERVHEYAQSEELLSETEFWSGVERDGAASIYCNCCRNGIARDGDSVSITLNKDDTNKLLIEVNKAYNTEITEILLAALGLAIKEWSGRNTVPVSVEGHGREGILQDINITRTVGWFTAIYPVILNVERSDDLAYVIKNVKEKVRHVPRKGTGYGILKYMAGLQNNKNVGSFMEPEIGFNYLGQFDEGSGNEIFNLLKFDLKSFFSENSERIYKLDIIGVTLNKELHIIINYNKIDIEREEIEKLIQSYYRNLQRLMDHCGNLETNILMPSDVGDKQLTVEELEFILDAIKDI